MTTLISISGKARRGKTTLANELCEREGYVSMSWADSLREEVEQPHNICVEYDVRNDSTNVQIDEGPILHDKDLAVAILYWMSEAEGVSEEIDYSRTGEDESVIRYVLHRHRMKGKDGLLLQWWGTDYRRSHFGQDYWVSRLMERASASLKGGKSVVIDDTRFPNEVEAVRLCKEADRVISIRIEREHPLEDTGRDDAHESENMLNTYLDWDMTLHNEGSIDQLYATFKAQEAEDIFAYSGSDHVVRRA